MRKLHVRYEKKLLWSHFFRVSSLIHIAVNQFNSTKLHRKYHVVKLLPSEYITIRINSICNRLRPVLSSWDKPTFHSWRSPTPSTSRKQPLEPASHMVLWKDSDTFIFVLGQLTLSQLTEICCIIQLHAQKFLTHSETCFFSREWRILLHHAMETSHTLYPMHCLCSGPFTIQWNVTNLANDIKPDERDRNGTSPFAFRSATGTAHENSCRHQILLHGLNFPGAFFVEIVVSNDDSAASSQFNFSIVRPDVGKYDVTYSSKFADLYGL